MKKHLISTLLLLVASSMFAADLSITSSAVIPSTSAQKTNGTAGATIAAGETVYQDTTDSNKFKLADGNGTVAVATVYGMALNSASAGQPITVLISDPSLTIGSHGAALGTPFFQSANAGKVCPFADLATGNRTSCVLIILTSTTVYFKPFGPGGAVP